MTFSVLPFEQRSVTAPNGGVAFGVIPTEVALEAGIPSGDVRCLNGFQGRDGKGFGRAHLIAKPARFAQLLGLGFVTIEHFIQCVAGGFDAICEGEDGRIMLARDYKGYALYLVLEWRDDREFWSVITGLPKRALIENAMWERERTGRCEPQPNSAVSPRFATLSLPIKPAGKGS